jgi:hypothetical protein
METHLRPPISAPVLADYCQDATQQAIERVHAAAAGLDVLAATNEAEALETAAAARRKGLRAHGAELALKLITLKLERAVQAAENPETELPGLEPLVRTVVGLDPEQKQVAGAVRVEIVYRQEGRSEGTTQIGVAVQAD